MLATGEFTKEEICLDILGLLAAGMDTTAALTASMLYWVKRHPHVLDKLYKEMDASGLRVLENVSFEFCILY